MIAAPTATGRASTSGPAAHQGRTFARRAARPRRSTPNSRTSTPTNCATREPSLAYWPASLVARRLLGVGSGRPEDGADNVLANQTVDGERTTGTTHCHADGSDLAHTLLDSRTEGDQSGQGQQQGERVHETVSGVDRPRRGETDQGRPTTFTSGISQAGARARAPSASSAAVKPGASRRQAVPPTRAHSPPSRTKRVGSTIATPPSIDSASDAWHREMVVPQ